MVANEKKCFLPRFFKRTFLKSPNDGLTMKDQVLSSAVGALRAVRLCPSGENWTQAEPGPEKGARGRVSAALSL